MHNLSFSYSPEGNLSLNIIHIQDNLRSTTLGNHVAAQRSASGWHFTVQDIYIYTNVIVSQNFWQYEWIFKYEI